MEESKGNNNSSNVCKTKETEFPFGNKENTIAILNALFRHGRQDLPFNILDMSTDEWESRLDSALKLTETVVKNKPSIVDWLRSGLFEENECNVSLALLFITLYEQHPLPDEKNVECDFRELYYFLHKVTSNQPVPNLSHNSAVVLHKLLSDVMDEVWPSMQPVILNYLSKIHIYSRPPIRRTYSRKC